MRGLWRSCWYAVPFRVWPKLRSRLPKSHQLPASHTQSKVLRMVLSFWMPHSMTEARSQEALSCATFLLLLRQQHRRFIPGSSLLLLDRGSPNHPSRGLQLLSGRGIFRCGPGFHAPSFGGRHESRGSELRPPRHRFRHLPWIPHKRRSPWDSRHPGYCG